MNGDAPISWLMFFTLAAVIVVAAGAFLSFLRSRHNREIAAYTLQGDGRSRGVEPSGAAPELFGLFALALVAMALLTFGYNGRNGITTVGAGTGASQMSATPPAAPVAPKPYQPENPAPDTRAAPTGSTTGSGPDSGGHPEQAPK